MIQNILPDSYICRSSLIAGANHFVDLLQVF